MGGGTQPAWQAPPPSICVRACGDAPPPFCPAPCTCNGAAQNLKACEPGALKGSGPRPALRVRTTPCAFRVPDPYAPPFACHAHIVPHAGRRAQGGMRKVGCRGRARGTTRGVVRTPPPRRCASRKQRRSNPHRPRPPVGMPSGSAPPHCMCMGQSEREGGHSRTPACKWREGVPAAPAACPLPSSRSLLLAVLARMGAPPCTPFARAGSEQKGGGAISQAAVHPPSCATLAWVSGTQGGGCAARPRFHTRLGRKRAPVYA